MRHAVTFRIAQLGQREIAALDDLAPPSAIEPKPHRRTVLQNHEQEVNAQGRDRVTHTYNEA